MKAPLLFVHYMPWFVSKPVSGVWGWHWTMNAFNPEKVEQGKRQIASHYYPLIGPYDSQDPSVLEYHLLLMKLAGLDGVIVDWYGRIDLYDYAIIHRNTEALFQRAKSFGLKFGVCFEDQIVPKLVETKKIPPEERVAYVRQELDWLQKNWFSGSTYLRLDGKPVLLSFGNAGLSDSEWEQVFAKQQGAIQYLSEHVRRSAAAGTFDWPDPGVGLAALTRYDRDQEPGKITMPVAFPRFDDCYQEGKAQKGYPKIPDENGKTFQTTLTRAWRSGAPLLQIATWNDWGEGTGIEPTQEFGYRDLEVLLGVRAQPGYTPADLRLPYRLWKLRQTKRFEPQLDSAVSLLVTGKLVEAKKILLRCEAQTSVPRLQ